MTDIDGVTGMVEQAEQSQGERYPLLVGIHDALRVALAETDGDAPAPGR